ncbi:hypothetical protein DZC18_001432 [Clostridium beijerinckii]|nr:hypothetical protein [Clostridium beijerinckii]
MKVLKKIIIFTTILTLFIVTSLNIVKILYMQTHKSNQKKL